MPFIFARAFKRTDGWAKINDVTWFLRRLSNQVSVNARNSGRVCLSETTENEERFILTLFRQGGPR